MYTIRMRDVRKFDLTLGRCVIATKPMSPFYQIRCSLFMVEGLIVRNKKENVRWIDKIFNIKRLRTRQTSGGTSGIPREKPGVGNELPFSIVRTGGTSEDSIKPRRKSQST